jgi:hypothetical protein
VAVNGESDNIAVAWTQFTYAATLSESGLPAGTHWSATINGTEHSSSSSTMEVRLANGTYPFIVGRVPGFAADPAKGTIIVDGAVPPVTLTFSANPSATYTVTFTASGLAQGMNWSVTFNGGTKASTGSIGFSGIGNGTYAFSIVPVSGYAAAPGSGSVVVQGPPAPQTIVFTSTAPPPSNGARSPTFLALTGMEAYALVGAVVLGGVGASILLGFRRKRKGASPALEAAPGPSANEGSLPGPATEEVPPQP